MLPSFLSSLLDPHSNLNGFNQPFGTLPNTNEVNVFLDNTNFAENIGQKLIDWLNTQLAHFVDWFIPTMQNFLIKALDQGVSLFQLAIIAIVTFNIYKIIADHKRDEALEKTFMFGLYFVLSVFFKAFCLA